MSEQRALITGGQGFIGRHLALRILKDAPGAEVLCIGRSSALSHSFTHWLTWRGVRVPAPMGPDLRAAFRSRRYAYERADLSDGPAVARIIQRFEPTVVYHLAGALRGEATQRLAQNIGTTEALLEAVARFAPEATRIVIASSGGVYGPRPRGRPRVSERSRPNPVDLYATTKLAAEHAANVLARRHGLDVACARIFNVLGPGQDERHIAGSLGGQLVAIEQGHQPPVIAVGPLASTRDFLDVRDVAKALHRIGATAAPGTYNVASGVETPVRALFDAVVRMARHDGPIAVETLEGRPDDTPRVVVDTRRLRSLGFEPDIPLDRSLEDILDYYRSCVGERRPRHRQRPRRSANPRANGSKPALRVAGRLDFGYAVEVAAGLLAELPARLVRAHGTRCIAVLTDERVHALHGRQFADGLRSRGADVAELRIPVGEAAKAFDSYVHVIRRLYEIGFDRKGLLVCLGGGVVIDVGGFAAASYMRGIGYVNVPTTLLAQADAAVGGKVAVNAPWAKNFVGAFHHPEGVFADPSVLRSLDRRQMASGVAEAIKVAVIGDPRLFDLLDEHRAAILDERDAGVLEDVVRAAVAQKIRHLAADPYERDLRRVLNFGHCVGHPFETAAGYGTILHGEAVALGMCVATSCAADLGLIAEAEADRIRALIGRYDLLPALSADAVETALDRLDAIRLVRGGRLNFVMPTGIGSVTIVDDIERGRLAEGIARNVGAYR